MSTSPTGQAVPALPEIASSSPSLPIAKGSPPALRAMVLDTNVVLDLWLYNDPRTAPLREGLAFKRWRWIATPDMREELRRVLAYPHIAQRLARNSALSADSQSDLFLRQFDDHVTCVETASAIAFRCKDADDQKFIDLAAAYGAILLSKDNAVLRMKKRLATLGVACAPSLDELV